MKNMKMSQHEAQKKCTETNLWYASEFQVAAEGGVTTQEEHSHAKENEKGD